MSHVFVSYVREDQPLVDRLVAALRADQLEVWLDREQIAPGSRWQAAIRAAIEHGALFVACFSSSYSRRTTTYVNEELTLAIDELRRRPVDRTWFIPVLLDRCEVPDRRISAAESLRDIQWIDLSDNWEEGIGRLRAAARHLTRSPQSAPPASASAGEASTLRHVGVRSGTLRTPALLAGTAALVAAAGWMAWRSGVPNAQESEATAKPTVTLAPHSFNVNATLHATTEAHVSDGGWVELHLTANGVLCNDPQRVYKTWTAKNLHTLKATCSVPVLANTQYLFVAEQKNVNANAHNTVLRVSYARQ